MPTRIDRHRALDLVGRWILVLVVLGLCSCGTTRTKRPAATVTRSDTGFSIEESAGVGVLVRSDFSKAYRLIEEGESTRGIELLREIAESEPELAAVHINLGIALRRAKDFEGAEKALLTAVEVDPRHPVAHNELGIVHRRTGRFEDARKSYEKALSLQPRFHFARKNLAVLCDLFLSDIDCALENYEIYQSEVADDENVGIWIADLRNRHGR